MKRFTLGASLVAIGVGVLAAPGPAAASSSCNPTAVGHYYKLTRIHATHVGCGLARELARRGIRLQRGSSRHLYYDWHRFRCFGLSDGASVNTTIRWHCHRHQGHQRVRFREFIVD